MRKEILEVVIDFETYFDAQYSLRKQNTMSYVRAKEFESQGVAIKIGDDPTDYYCGPDEVAEGMNELAELSKKYHLHIVAFNTKFDALIAFERYSVKPAFYYDVMAMAKGLYPHHPSDLKSVAKRVFPSRKEFHKLEALDQVKGVRYADFTDEQKQLLGTYCIRDVDATHALFKQLKEWVPQDELDLIHLTTRMFVEPEIVVDINRLENVRDNLENHRKAVIEEFEEIHNTLYDTTFDPKIFTSNDRFVNYLVNHLDIPKENIPKKISPRTGKETWALAKNDVPYIQFKTEYKQHLKLFKAREAVKSRIAATRAARMIEAAETHPEHKLCVPLVYYKAHTGRYGGNEKINLQNLQRGSEHRLALTSDKGKLLYVIDSSNIEARMLAWFAGESRLLEQYANGEDTYSILATKIYGFLVNKQDNPKERSLGKVAQLGLGYQMGIPKFKTTLESGPMGLDPMEVDYAFAEKVVTTYRRENPMIVQSWKRAQQAIRQMTEPGAGIPWGPLIIKERCIELPNGMYLQYPQLSVREVLTAYGEQYEYNYLSYNAANRKWEEKKIYGGKLIENIVQALSRIVIVDQMLRMEKALAKFDAKVVLQVHDEIIVSAPEEHKEEIFAIMEDIMNSPPEWCSDLPLASEGGYDTCYSK